MSAPEMEEGDLIAQAKGRAQFCRDRGEVKTPMLLDELIARIAQLEAERDSYREKWVRDTGKLAVYAETQEDRADRAEARLREAEAKVARLREVIAYHYQRNGTAAEIASDVFNGDRAAPSTGEGT